MHGMLREIIPGWSRMRKQEPLVLNIFPFQLSDTLESNEEATVTGFEYIPLLTFWQIAWMGTFEGLFFIRHILVTDYILQCGRIRSCEKDASEPRDVQLNAEFTHESAAEHEPHMKWYNCRVRLPLLQLRASLSSK